MQENKRAGNCGVCQALGFSEVAKNSSCEVFCGDLPGPSPVHALNTALQFEHPHQHDVTNCVCEVANMLWVVRFGCELLNLGHCGATNL